MFASDDFNTSNMKTAVFEDDVLCIRVKKLSKPRKILNRDFLSGVEWKRQEARFLGLAYTESRHTFPVKFKHTKNVFRSGYSFCTKMTSSA